MHTCASIVLRDSGIAINSPKPCKNRNPSRCLVNRPYYKRFALFNDSIKCVMFKYHILESSHACEVMKGQSLKLIFIVLSPNVALSFRIVSPHLCL